MNVTNTSKISAQTIKRNNGFIAVIATLSCAALTGAGSAAKADGVGPKSTPAAKVTAVQSALVTVFAANPQLAAFQSILKQNSTVQQGGTPGIKAYDVIGDPIWPTPPPAPVDPTDDGSGNSGSGG